MTAAGATFVARVGGGGMFFGPNEEGALIIVMGLIFRLKYALGL